MAIVDYIRNGISIIPVTKRWNDKKEIWSGKFSAIKGWENYCVENSTESELDKWKRLDYVTGVAIATGEASNIACVDIDTTNPVLIKTIKEEILPYTPCVILGAKGRGGKLLFRLFDEHDHKFEMPEKRKQSVKNEKNETVVDIFYGNSYLVAPPSLHSMDKDGKNRINYSWENNDFDLSKISISDLPVLTDVKELKEKIEMAVKGMATSEINKNVTLGSAIDLSSVAISSRSLKGHRHEDMISFVASLIAKRIDITSAIGMLLSHDQVRNSDDLYFMDKEKGFKSESSTLNAIKFYMANLDNKIKHKKISDMELPTIEVVRSIEDDQWGSINTLILERDITPFKYDWIRNEELREYIRLACEANQVSPQMIFFYMLSSFSGILGNKVKCQPYSNNKFIQTCNLYIGIVAGSGGRKTNATAIGLAPIKALNKSIKQKAKDDAKQSAKMVKSIGIRIKSIQSKLIKEIESLDGEEYENEYTKDYESNIEKLRDKLPSDRDISIMENEVTVQKMYEILVDNPTGVFIEINELGAKWAEWCAQGKEKDRSFILNCWDGVNYFQNKTKHQGQEEVQELCISIATCCQYDVINGIIEEVDKKRGNNDGLIQRFLFFCADEIEQKVVDIGFKYPSFIDSVFENAYYIEKKEDPICLSEDAYRLWIKFQEDQIARKKYHSGELIEPVIQKHDGYAVRIAANIAIMNNNGNRPNDIDSESFRIAVEIIDYSYDHAKSLYQKQRNNDLRNKIDMFKHGIIEDGTTMRDLYRNHQSVFGKTSTQVKDSLDELVVRNIVKIIKDGRSSKVYVNPALFV